MTLLTVIEDDNQIQRAQQKLQRAFKSFSDRSGIIIVGYKGGNTNLRVHYSRNIGLWWGHRMDAKARIPRFWNPFGVGEPKWDSKISHDITCEINVPLSGVSRAIAGAFVQDESGEIYLAHSGKIGGGRKGIGQKTFKENFSGSKQWKRVYDSKAEREMVVISELSSPRLMNRIANFITEVHRIKQLVTSGQTTFALKLQGMEFKPEPVGTRTYELSKTIQAQCDHGLIINTIKDIMVEHGCDAWNNKFTDLLVKGKDEKLAFVEAKTDSDTTNLYQAIGQLLYHSSKINYKTTLIVVFPNTISQESKDVFGKLGIVCLTYTWQNNKPVFDEKLDEVFSRLG